MDSIIDMKEVRLTETGTLEIKRNGSWKPQYCPFQKHQTDLVRCGDWCPLFSEPYSALSVSEAMCIRTCHSLLYFMRSDLEDLRNENKLKNDEDTGNKS